MAIESGDCAYVYDPYKDSLRCLKLRYTGHPEDRDSEALVGMDQAVFLAVDV